MSGFTLFGILACTVATSYGRSWNQPEASLYFSWNDCGKDSNRPLKVHDVTLSPDPVTFPGPLAVSVDVESTATIENADLDLTIKKKTIFGYITVPCISNVGSCTYSDLCKYIDLIPDQPIKCPLPPRRITIKDKKFDLPDLGSLGSFISGGFKVKGQFIEHTKKTELGCFEVEIKIKA